LVKKTAGNEVTLATYHGRMFSSLGQSAKIVVTARGSLMEVRLNNVRVLQVVDTTYATGLIGLRIYGDPDNPCDASFARRDLPLTDRGKRPAIKPQPSSKEH
jgi:hypothetical protein